jgi:predicted transcriptional regulator
LTLGDEEGLSIVEKVLDKDGRFISDSFEEDKRSALVHRRDRHDIIAEILKTARQGMKKTYIMYRARLSHSQLKQYLELLNRNGMIVQDDGVYKTTPKGLTFVREFESINFLFRQ